MRNLFEIVPKFNRIVDKSSILRITSILSKKFSTSEEKPLIHEKRTLQNVSETIRRNMKIIRMNKSKLKSRGHTMYLLNERAAKEFASMVVANRISGTSHVIEINSGLGLLTKELLEAGISYIQMFEGITDFHPNLLSLTIQYPDRLSLITTDFYQLWHLSYADWINNTETFNSHFLQVKKRSWIERPAIEIIGAISDINFINRLIASVVYRTAFSQYGRMTVFAAVPPSVTEILTSKKNDYLLYKARTILFQTFFQYSILGNLPRSAFYPNHKKIKKNTRKCIARICQNDSKIMHVMKIEPKPNICDDNFTESDMIPFYYFVKHHFKARSSKVIPAMENWIPGCGRILITQGYTIFTEFGELTSQQVFKLYKDFKSWKGYKNSTFLSCAKTFYLNEYGTFDTNGVHFEEIFRSGMKEFEEEKNKSMKE